MAGEAIRVTSPWENIITEASIGNGATSAESTSIANTTTLSANEKLYELVEFELTVGASDTPAAAGATVDLFRRPKANGDGWIPATAYREQYVGTFVLLNAQSGSYYIYGAVLEDEADTYYLINNDAGTIALGLNARTKTSGPAA